MALIKYTGSNIKSAKAGEDIIIDEGFKVYLDQMNTVAVKHKITVLVTSSYRKDTNVAGAIVTPAKASNHLVGHAIDCNLMKGSQYFNSKAMGDGQGDDELFCKEVVATTGLRWGQAFNVKDSVHFDSSLNIYHQDIWLKLYKEYHV